VYAEFEVFRPIISNRDFVWYAVDSLLPNGIYVSLGRSMKSSFYPEKPGRVRGTILASGYVVEPIPGDPNSSKVYYVAQVDPRGWVPAWAVNFVAKSQAYNPGLIKEKIPQFLEQRKKAQLEAEKAASLQQPHPTTNPTDTSPPTTAPTN